MMIYPQLKPKATIGVTAPSSGIEKDYHFYLEQCCKKMERLSYQIIIGETVWTQEKAKSAPAKKRAVEFEEMIHNENIDLIIPPWGGELLIEILDKIDFEKLPVKWVKGYSDTSTLLLAITLKTGIATAHGTNLVDLRGEYSDETTAMWEAVLKTEAGESITQVSSAKYQKKWEEWQLKNPTPCIYNLTEDTKWQTISGEPVALKGRLLGGCVDVIRHLVGTPYGNVQAFRERYIKGEPIIWYFENCDLNTTDLRRSLVQMKYGGWFENCAGLLFGRSAANTPVEDYLILDVYEELVAELQLPLVYDIDCGHSPPQMTLINGAFAEVSVKDGKGIIKQTFI